MMPNQNYGAFQRGSSCQQGRPAASCAQAQMRGAAPGRQMQQGTASNCGQTQQRAASSCGQTQQRTASNCGQAQQGAASNCGQTQQRTASNCGQTQQRTASSCSQTQQRAASNCGQTQQRSVSGAQGQGTRPSGVSPSCPCSQMSQAQLLQWITLTKFACVDASLFLDTHPDDEQALRFFQEHNRLYNEAMDAYAKAYGPLTISHARNCDTYWDWVNQPWPWQ